MCEYVCGRCGRWRRGRGGQIRGQRGRKGMHVPCVQMEVREQSWVFVLPFPLVCPLCLLLPRWGYSPLSALLSIIGVLRFQMHATVTELMWVLGSTLRSSCFHTEHVHLDHLPSLLSSSMQILELPLYVRHFIFSPGKH